MDATYKTNKYDWPCFVISVPTNIGFIPVAMFMVQHERTENISEALKILKDWNPDWEPANFMTDYDEREIGAIESVFKCV